MQALLNAPASQSCTIELIDVLAGLESFTRHSSHEVAQGDPQDMWTRGKIIRFGFPIAAASYAWRSADPTALKVHRVGLGIQEPIPVSVLKVMVKLGR